MGVSARLLLGTWLPPVLLMAVIFALSAQPDLSSGLGLIDLIGRKLIHAGEYGLLCFLWWRALRTLPMERRTALAGAAAVALLYAASDEWHQTFVAGRHGTPVDVLIDAVGIALTGALIGRRERRNPTAAVWRASPTESG